MGNYAQIDGLNIRKSLILNGQKVEKSAKKGLTLPLDYTILSLVS
jgi:hypothetical protein